MNISFMHHFFLKENVYLLIVQRFQRFFMELNILKKNKNPANFHRRGYPTKKFTK